MSLPGLTGQPSIPETFVLDREAAAYWMPRLTRGMTVEGLSHAAIALRWAS
jgi:hypothetical protein